jgi:hypothetical protein
MKSFFVFVIFLLNLVEALLEKRATSAVIRKALAAKTDTSLGELIKWTVNSPNIEEEAGIFFKSRSAARKALRKAEKLSSSGSSNKITSASVGANEFFSSGSKSRAAARKVRKAWKISSSESSNKIASESVGANKLATSRTQSRSAARKARKAEKLSSSGSSDKIAREVEFTTIGTRQSLKQLEIDAKDAKKEKSKNGDAISSGIGFDLLKKMGWNEGEGLGKEGTGMKEPIFLTRRLPSNKLGLGSDSPLPLPKPKRIKKTPNRFSPLDEDLEDLERIPLQERFSNGGSAKEDPGMALIQDALSNLGV